ncbi:hypothetical protein DFH07DRAFT_811795 [Mycena maculata]|uniref:Uncharacterized protein n=1 Tax=Mycena maculata TaxID=230809 RepID=A0AAD7JJG7_9AGAR|nr:hypothetical protein DFH07DRAFT_811795 [Mycena maculata]
MSRTRATLPTPARTRRTSFPSHTASYRITLSSPRCASYRRRARAEMAPAVAQLTAEDVSLGLSEVVDAMQAPDFLRMGGAPSFWDAWHPLPEDAGEDAPAPVDKDKSEAEVEGWDWASVEGEWWCIFSFVDFQDILRVSNIRRDDLQELLLFGQTTLRVVCYSAPPHEENPHQLLYRLPVIHIAGESRGRVTNELEGTVRMVGDGEMVTESVQVGNIGSAFGNMGLWTYTNRSPSESTTTLGVFSFVSLS